MPSAPALSRLLALCQPCPAIPPIFAPLQEELLTQLADKVSAFQELEARFARLEEDTGATQVGAGAPGAGCWLVQVAWG